MAVLYMGVYLPGGRTEDPVFQNILIEQNSFIDCPRQAMFLSSCRNVIVRGNTVINALKLDLEAPCYGSSTMEKPIYGEHYEGVIQFEKRRTGSRRITISFHSDIRKQPCFLIRFSSADFP